jgi:hypothetical protein
MSIDQTGARTVAGTPPGTAGVQDDEMRRLLALAVAIAALAAPAVTGEPSLIVWSM